MALTGEQKAAVLASMNEDGKSERKAFIALSLPLEDLRTFRDELRTSIRGVKEDFKVPRAPLNEWAPGQLGKEKGRMNALKAAKPAKAARANARIAEIDELLEE